MSRQSRLEMLYQTNLKLLEEQTEPSVEPLNGGVTPAEFVEIVNGLGDKIRQNGAVALHQIKE